MGNFQANKFYFIFSTDDVSRIDEHFSEFKYASMGINLANEYIDVNSKKGFKEILKKIESECTENEIKPFIHFECHGDQSGIILKSKAKIFWNILANYLTGINIACKNNLFVSFSNCYGGHLTFSILKQVTERKKCRTPVYGLIGPIDTITFEEIRIGYDEFFKTILLNNSIDAGIDKLVENTKQSSGYITMTCETLLERLFDTFLKMEAERKFKNSIQFNAYLAEQARNYLYQTGKFMTRNDLEKLAEINLNKDFYLEYFRELQTHFLMLDLFPENSERFSTVNDIENWDVFLARIQK